jgi:hypothetical protein
MRECKNNDYEAPKNINIELMLNILHKDLKKYKSNTLFYKKIVILLVAIILLLLQNAVIHT